MNIIDWYKKVVFENYANFSGRARRSEYWWFILANFILSLIMIGLDMLVGTSLGDSPQGIIYFIYLILVFIPSLAVAVRRLHDTGKSGWYYFLILIPIIGAIWLIVLFATEGDRGTNQYGKDPKGNDEINEIGQKQNY